MKKEMGKGLNLRFYNICEQCQKPKSEKTLLGINKTIFFSRHAIDSPEISWIKYDGKELLIVTKCLCNLCKRKLEKKLFQIVVEMQKLERNKKGKGKGGTKGE